MDSLRNTVIEFSYRMPGIIKRVFSKFRLANGFYLTAIFQLFLLIANGQLDKGIWLVGGSGTFYSYKATYDGAGFASSAKYTQANVSTSVGYFVIDKLAVGIKPTFSSIKGRVTSTGGLATNVQRYWIGPFARYYFLNPEKPFNLLSEASYQFGVLRTGGQSGKLRTFSALAGPVIYFNTIVGIEFLLGYAYSIEDEAIKQVNQGFQFSVGFQIHLEN